MVSKTAWENELYHALFLFLQWTWGTKASLIIGTVAAVTADKAWISGQRFHFV
jgi:hypothetical protein